MRDSRLRMHQRSDFARIDVDAVCCNDLRLEQPLLLHIRDDRNAIFLAHVFHLEGSLCKMRVEWHIKFFGKLGSGAQDFGCARVWSMGGDRGHDQWVTL